MPVSASLYKTPLLVTLSLLPPVSSIRTVAMVQALIVSAPTSRAKHLRLTPPIKAVPPAAPVRSVNHQTPSFKLHVRTDLSSPLNQPLNY